MPETKSENLSKITTSQIIAYQNSTEAENNLKETDIELHIMPVEYAKGNSAPLDFVKFYKHKEDNCTN